MSRAEEQTRREIKDKIAKGMAAAGLEDALAAALKVKYELTQEDRCI